MALMWDNTWLRVKEKCEQKKKGRGNTYGSGIMAHTHVANPNQVIKLYDRLNVSLLILFAGEKNENR